MQPYLTEIQSLALVSDLERRKNLFEFKLDGYSAWRVVRSKVLNKLQQLPFVDKRPSYLKPEWSLERLLLFIPDILSLLSARRSKFFIKTFSSALNDRENGHYKDVYFDDVFRASDSCFKVETLNNASYSQRRRKAMMPASLTTAAVDLIAAFCILAFPSREMHKVAKQLLSELHEEPALQKIDLGDLKLTLKRFFWLKRIYSYLLKKVQPTHVLVADSGEFALLAAAQELKLKTIEFQHGVFIREHPDALPKLNIRDRKPLLMPGKLFLFGEYWKEQLADSELLESELTVVGNPRIDRYRKIRSEYRSSRVEEKVQILVTTQGVDRERLIEFLTGFVKTAEGNLRYCLTIKLHPISERDKRAYHRVFKDYPAVEILQGSELPSTFDLLAQSDFHASIASATHYDALGLGVPTIIIPLAGHEVVMPLVDAGHARLARTPEEMYEIIQSADRLAISNEISTYYFAPDSYRTIRKELGIQDK